MRTRIAFAIASAVVLVAAMAAVALAAADHHNTGKLIHASYNTGKQTGHVTLKHKDKKTKYRLTSDTVCGKHKGESGGPIECKDLTKAKYHNHSTQVTWHKGPNGGRVASLVSVSEG